MAGNEPTSSYLRNRVLSDGISVAPFVEGFMRWSLDVTMYVRYFYRNELGVWLKDFSRRRRGVGRRVVYIASHGTRGRLGGLPDGSAAVNFQTFLQMLRQTPGLDGVHLGCCCLGNSKNAALLLHADRRRRPRVACRWVAGYGGDIDWFDSMLIDLSFWRFVLMDPTHDAWEAAIKTYRHFPRAKEMGFSVFMNGRGGRVRDSLREGFSGASQRKSGAQFQTEGIR